MSELLAVPADALGEALREQVRDARSTRARKGVADALSLISGVAVRLISGAQACPDGPICAVRQGVALLGMVGEVRAELGHNDGPCQA